MESAPVVRLAGVQYGYGGTPAVRADLAIGEGEVVAVLGPNGSGKSTLVKGMLGLVDRYGGEVEWFGQPDREFADRWRVGYVPQRTVAPGAIPVTVDEVVRSGRVARAGLLIRRRGAESVAVSAAIDVVGLGAYRRTPIAHLSGGQQRRTLVARALAGGPDVLVLDEPFAGVDAASQDALAGTFARLAGQGVTLVIVLHELGALEHIISRAVVLVGGRVVYDGPPAGRPDELSYDHHHHHDDDPPYGSMAAEARLGLG